VATQVERDRMTLRLNAPWCNDCEGAWHCGGDGTKAHGSEVRQVEEAKDVRFPLRMLAINQGTKLSMVANEVFDKALPRWTLERAE
jgi:hypothetical protein